MSKQTDLPTPDYIPLRQAASELPRRRAGKKTHVSTLIRWADHGCRGIHLKTVRIGHVRCTTREWLAEFIEASSAAAARGDAVPCAVRSPASRHRAVEAADAELARLGI